MKCKNLIVLIGIFLIVLFNSVVYGALNTDMFIDGEAHVRVDRDIRITGIKVEEQINGAYETYSSKYSKDTTSLQVTLPSSNSVMIYEVIITNKGDINYKVSDIIEESYLNNNIKYEIINLEKGTIINGETTYTFKIKLTTTENIPENKGTLVLKYTFEELQKEWLFDYSGEEQVFQVPYDGVYKLETWGAQGGNVKSFSYGGYSTGEVFLTKNRLLYVYVGGKGGDVVSNTIGGTGGYNGGGSGGNGIGWSGAGGGGGATHIAFKSGLLATLENDKDDILMVSGGGGEVVKNMGNANGGGIVGGNGVSNSCGGLCTGYEIKGATQTTGYSFGLGQNGISKSSYADCGAEGNGGGGGGYYGGFASQLTGKCSTISGGAGSGYIGNSLLTNKSMYCYECEESQEDATKTISTTNTSEAANSNYVKIGNGYARITLIKK